LLIEQYDDRYKVLNEYKRELKSWSRLKPNDSLNLRKLYTFVMMFKTTVLRGDDDINTEIIELIHSKLPTYIQDRWNRAALKIRKSQKRKPSLHDFLELLQEEISLATDTLYSRQGQFVILKTHFQQENILSHKHQSQLSLCSSTFG